MPVALAMDPGKNGIIMKLMRCLYSGRGVGAGSIAGQLILLAAIAGCGGKTDSSDASVGATGGAQALGTGGAQSTLATRGGATAVGLGGKTNGFGGKSPAGGTATGGATGGTKATGLGGATGGTKATGLGGATGGTKATGLGGAFGGATGGSKATGLGGTATGGNATGGTAIGTFGGGASTGGTTVVGFGGATGGSAALGGSAGKAGSLVGVAGVAGAALADFCVGDVSKVSYQGQELSPATFNYDAMVALDCCDGFGVGLHTRDQLGYDLALEVIHTLNSTGLGPGQLTVGTGMLRSVTLSRFGASSTTARSTTTGSMGLVGNVYGSTAWEVGFCLVANPLSEVFAGTRIYVPRATVIPYDWMKRFQIYQLADLTTTPAQAQSLGLSALVLAATPWLDLRSIAYVEQSPSTFNITVSSAYGSSLRSQLDGVTTQHRPFVVKADDVPIYVGTFMRWPSPVMPLGPVIEIDKITDDRIFISAPVNDVPDARSDVRIIKALSESGKLVP